MELDSLHDLLELEQKLMAVADASRGMADAAAHQLAQFMSDEVRRPADTGAARRDALLNLIEVYDLSWVGYLDAREAWREANRRALDAHQAQSHTEGPQTDVEA